MPLFTEDIKDNSHLSGNPASPDPYTGPAQRPAIPSYFQPGPSGGDDSGPASYSDIIKGIETSTITPGTPNTQVSDSILMANKRYETYRPNVDYEDIYSQAQSGWDRIANAGIQFTNKVGAYLTQTAGFIAGAPAALVGGAINLTDEALGGKGELINNGNAVSNMTDNFLTELGDVWKEKVAEYNPIYKSYKYTHGNIWDKLSSTDWWLDDAVDRLALTASMIIPGVAEARGIGLWGMVADEAGVLRATGAGSKMVQALADNPDLYGKIGKALGNQIYKTAVDGVVDLGAEGAIANKALAFKNAVQTAQRLELYSWNVIGQSALNGREAQVGIRRALHEQREAGLINLTEEEIEKKAAEGAAKGFWYTVPVALSASLIELPQIFSTARSAQSSLKKLFNPKTLEVLEDATKSARPSVGWTLTKAVLTGIEHGPINENLQVAIGRYLEDSIAGKVKGDKIEYDHGNPISSILYDWVDNVNDPNGQNNIALGFIQGMLMTTGGYAKSIIKGEYAAQDAQNKRYIEIINKAKAQRRFWSTPENFIERDETNPSKIKVDDKGNPVFDQQKLADMGMTLAGAADAYQKRTKAIKENDKRTLDELNKDSLAALAQNFFDDPKGMEYLTNLLRFEAKNQKENINRINDSQNGIEHSPEYQLQENLTYVEKLKKAYDAIENRHAGFTALDVNLKDPNEVKARAAFIESHRNAQYFVGAEQIFLMDRIQKNNTELGALGITEFVKEPSNPSEERANQLIEENEENQQQLDAAKDNYKFLIDKEQFKERFNAQRDKYRETLKSVEAQKANAAAEAEKQANMTPEELAASKKVKIKTKTGESEYEIGEEYYVGTVIVGKDAKGFEEISFPKIVILKDNGDGTIRIKDAKGERDITKAALESYKLGKMSEIEKDKKAKFFYENRNTLFQFNFGKGNKVEGRLEYSPKDRILLFKYFDKKGKLREIEVTGDQFIPQKGFAQAMITPVGKITAIQEKALNEYAAEKDVRTFDKRTARLKILDQLFDETSTKLEETKKLLQRKYTEFEKITGELTVIENKIKGGELTKRLNFKRTTAKAIQTANRLSRMQEELRKEIQGLEAEQENLESLQSYVADMAQNIDILPTDSKEFLNELREQVLDLSILQEETGKQINSMSLLIDQTEGALNKAMEFVRELITKFEQTYPKTPTAIVGQEWVDFLKTNPNFLKINTNFKEDLATVEDIISQIDDLDIIPGERTVAELRAELDGIINTLADVERELAAKEKILEKFETYAAEYKRVQEEEAAISKNEELINDVIGTLNKGSQNLQFDTKYEADPKKATSVVMKATTFPTERSEGGEAPAEHHQRANRFGSRFSQIKGKGKNIRGVIVTAKNESAVIPGLTEFLKQGKASVDASTTIALVMVEKGDDGVLHLVDENGERITKEQGLEKGIFQVFPMDISDMFRDGTEKYIIDGYSKQFKEWRTKQLANTEITDYNVDASFGNPEKVTRLDEKGNSVENYDARVSVEESGLITQADLAKNPMINVPTVESTITLGTTAFNNALGGVFLRLANGYVKLNNRQHTAKEASAIYDAIYRLSSIMVKDKTIKSEEAQRIVDWLRTVVFWGSPKEGKAPGYNAVYFDKGEDGRLKLYMSGKNKIVSEFTPTQLEMNKGNILGLLQEMYNNTNSVLTETKWKQPYEQIISISKDGTIERVMWPNYQTYLLSNKQADGKTARSMDDVPLSTRMRPLKNAEDTNRKGIYFIIDDAANDASFIKPEAPQKVTAVITPGAPKAQAPTQTQAQAATTAKFVLDGKTENTITLKAGNIKFIYDSANPDSFKNINIDPAIIDDYIASQKEKGVTITKDQAFNILSDYTLKQIKADIEATKVSKEAGKPAITTPPLAFVLDGVTVNTTILQDGSEIKFIFDENQVVEPGELPTIKYIKVPDSKIKEFMESKGVTEEIARSAYDNYVLKQVAAFQQSRKQAEAPKQEAPTSDAQSRKNKAIASIEKVADGWRTVADDQGGKSADELIADTKEEVLKLIDDKYKDELAALEGKPITPVTETKTTPVEAPKSADQVDSEIKKRIAERKGRVGKDVDLRVFIESQAGKFERENWDDVEKAIKQMFPNVPVYRVKNMLKGTNGVQAWGMLKDGALYIYENAEVGTAYHEIFEAVWKMVTPPAEQAAIRNEFKNREGSFTDRPTAKTIKYSEATDQQIKEQLAEEFRDYIHEGKLPPKPKDGRPFIVKLFSDLLNMIKSLFIGKAGSRAERLFKNIEKGKYRNYVPAESTLSYANKGIMDINDAYITEGAELREFPGLTNENVHDSMQQMTFVTLSYLMDDNQALFNIPDINKTELYTTLKENLLDRVVQQIVAAEDMVAEGQFTQQEVQHIIDNAEMLYQNIENNWDSLKEKHEEYLKTYSIEFDENDELALNNDEKSKEDPYGDANKIDHFRKANSAVKLILATLPMVDSKGNRQVSSVGGVKLIPLSEAYMAVINNVHDSVNEDAMIEGIRQMAIADKNYERLYSRLTKSPSSTNIINWDSFNEYDLKLLTSFLGTFNKQNPDVKLLNILAGGETQITDSNFSTAARQSKNDFVNDIRGVIKDKNPFFEFSVKEKGYVKKKGKDKKDPFDNVTLGDDASRIKFLKDLGIIFTQDDVTRLKYLGETERFNKAVAGILSSMKATDKIATISGTVLSIDGRLLTLGQLKAKLDNPEFSSTYYGVKGEKIQTYIGTNPSSDLYKALASIKNINELTTNPRYKQYSYLATDAFVKNSVILKAMFEPTTGDRISQTENLMKASIADGYINLENGKRKPSSKQTYKERVIQEINMNLDGYYYTLVPGDASMEWMTYMGNHISESVLKTGWESVHDVFKGYLIDEINLAREQRDIVTPKGTERKTTDLRFFKSIFENKESKKPNEIHNDIVTLALEKNKDGSFRYTAEEIYNNNKNKVDSAIEKYVKKETAAFKNTLTNYNVISNEGDGKYTTTTLKFADKNEITEEDLNRNLNALTSNFMINNIELHKLLYSDPYQYSDELKRIKNFLSPRQNMIHGSLMLNAALDRVWNKGMDATDIGYTDMTKDYFVSTTLTDVLGTHNLDGYKDALYKETDGSGIMSFKAYRNFRIRTNDWNEAEESQYRYDNAWEKRDKGLDLTPRDQEILDRGNPSVRSAYTARKPIVAGNKANGKSYNDVMLDKFAIYPLSYRVMKEINPTANSLKLYDKMQEEGIDYITFDSGRKVGAEKSNQIYTKEGAFTSAPFEGIINVPFAIMSVQSEVPSKEVSLVTRGSQATKEMTMDFMEAGVPIDFMVSGKNVNERYKQWLTLDEAAKEAASPLYKEIKNNESIIKELMEVGYQNVLKRLGMKDVNGKIEITEDGKSKAAETLREEILKREVNDNIADALIGFLKGDVVLEATPAYQQIRNILYSIADKEVISPKISGRMLVQIPSTFMESNRIEAVEINGKQAYASDVLKFYVDEDGKRTCEVMLGRWFESDKTDEELMNYFNNTEEGKKELAALASLAFRIPTQKQNSIESIKIAKFLPQEFGDNIIVPAALVQKAGSDFDIDKLTTYLKNMYVGRDGYPRMINFLTDENSTAEERYVHWVRENSNRDTQKYVRFLSRQYVQNLKSNFEIEAAKINAKYQAIRQEGVEDLFDDMQTDITGRKHVQLAAQDSYMEELFDMGKKVFWRMADTTRDSFWAVRDHIRQQGIKGPEEIRRYLALATSMIQDPRTIQNDIVKLEGLQKIYTEELRVMGIMEETINKIVKDAIAEFRENKKTLSNVLKMDKAPEFESLNDIYEDARSQQSFEGSQEIANIDGLASFDEFKTFSKYKQNVDKALQNAYIESSANLVSSKENFAQLIKPNSADQLKGLANEISELRGLGSFEYTSVGNMLSKNFMSRLRHAFVSGKYAIGIAAVSQTNHSLNQRQPIYFDFSKLNQIDSKDAYWMLANGGKINFVDGKGKPLYSTIQIDGKTVPTLSMIKNVDGQYISDIVAQFIDGYVDISKGPWIMELGATPNVAGTFLMLAKLGIPIDTVAYFMNQPIIRDYLRSIESSGYSYLFMQDYVDQIKNNLDYKEGITQVDKVTSIPNNKELKASIKAKKLSPIQKAEQIYMLDEFLKYAKMAEQLLVVTQGTNFDTANFNDPYLVFKKAVQLEKARNTILSSPDGTLPNTTISAADSLLKGSFLGDLANKIGSVREAMSNILTSDQGEIRDVMENVLRDYVDLPDREFVGVAQKAVNDFFDWAVQINENRNTFIERLLTADNSGAKKIADLKKAIAENPNHPLYNNYIIGKNGILETQMSSKNKGVDNISIKNKGNKVYDQNQIIYSFREIKKYVDEGAYKVLVGTSILQSGLSNSRISFTSLLPYEDFKKVYHDTLSNIKNLSNINIRDYYTLNVFERNNWADDDIIPRDKPKAPRRSATGKLIYNTRMKWDKQSKVIDKAIGQGKIPKLLKVSDLSRVGNSNFVVYSWEDMSISKAEKTKMKQAGDYSYINKGLFKKVYYADGTPVTTSYLDKKTGIEYTSYVYKMMNAWGDSFRANEFYNTPRTSVIDNGFMKVEETSTTIETAFGPEEIKTSPERSDEVIASYFSRDEIGDYNLAPEELLEDYSQKTGKTMGTETQIPSIDAESLKAQIAEIENKKKTTGLTPSEIATLSQMQTELGKIIKSQC